MKKIIIKKESVLAMLCQNIKLARLTAWPAQC